MVGSFAYAALTEPSWADLSPKTALLVMLVIPVLFAITYWFVMDTPETVYQVKMLNPTTWMVPPEADIVTLPESSGSKVRTSSSVRSYSIGWKDDTDTAEAVDKVSIETDGHGHVTQRILTMNEKLVLIVVCELRKLVKICVFHFQPLLKYMIPLSTVYLAEYLINQGLVSIHFYLAARLIK